MKILEFLNHGGILFSLFFRRLFEMVRKPAGFSPTGSHDLTAWAGGLIIGRMEVGGRAEYFVLCSHAKVQLRKKRNGF